MEELEIDDLLANWFWVLFLDSLSPSALFCASSKEIGVVSIQVRDAHETKRIIEVIIACLD